MPTAYIYPSTTSDNESVTVLRYATTPSPTFAVVPLSNGSDYVGQNPSHALGPQLMRPFWRFDLTDPDVFPPGSVLTGATLRIYVDHFTGGNFILLRVRKVSTTYPPTDEVQWAASNYVTAHTGGINATNDGELVTACVWFPFILELPVLGEINDYALAHYYPSDAVVQYARIGSARDPVESKRPVLILEYDTPIDPNALLPEADLSCVLTIGETYDLEAATVEAALEGVFEVSGEIETLPVDVDIVPECELSCFFAVVLLEEMATVGTVEGELFAELRVVEEVSEPGSSATGGAVGLSCLLSITEDIPEIHRPNVNVNLKANLAISESVAFLDPLIAGNFYAVPFKVSTLFESVASELTPAWPDKMSIGLDAEIRCTSAWGYLSHVIVTAEITDYYLKGTVPVYGIPIVRLVASGEVQYGG